eukprot:CAMPEP_0168521452 /NCGR_PEP_ID=MMETSP0405-20121227/8678_1 /TAXON_ID=498012 /ORGANISM="Trichosphaerium sp, Strain Am-I-7 wt" /LENGTH=397 /DNA_ID=CAMNT_0008542701 /DNA_START=43 /DNA_END=1236 /DNA_ORIENTATION=-
MICFTTTFKKWLGFAFDLGGVCHRDESQEKTLFEEKGLDVCQKFVKQIVVVESHGGGHCMCCGDPTFEFYDEADENVAMIAFHHGRSIRWYKGNWPCDMLLTPESAKFLVQRLADNGVTGPLNELMRGERQRQALRRRQIIYGGIIPRDIHEAVNNSQSDDDLKNVFENKFNAPAKKFMLYFGLYGCNVDSWNIIAGMDEFLEEECLCKPKANDITAALERIVKLEKGEPMASFRWFITNGIARWIFEERAHKDFDTSTMAYDMFLEISMVGLQSPRAYNRTRTLNQLREIGSDYSKKVLLLCLPKFPTPNTLEESDKTEPGGMVRFSGGDMDLLKMKKDRVSYEMETLVCFSLARLKVMDALPLIESAMKEATGEDVSLLEKSLEILKEPTKAQSE